MGLAMFIWHEIDKLFVSAWLCFLGWDGNAVFHFEGGGSSVLLTLLTGQNRCLYTPAYTNTFAF